MSYAVNFTAKTDDCIVYQDGVERFRGTNDKCWVYILTHQGHSVDWACSHGGWECIDNKSKEDV